MADLSSPQHGRFAIYSKDFRKQWLGLVLEVRSGLQPMLLRGRLEFRLSRLLRDSFRCGDTGSFDVSEDGILRLMPDRVVLRQEVQGQFELSASDVKVLGVWHLEGLRS